MQQKGQISIFDVIDKKKDVIKVGRMETQRAQILAHLKAGNSLTPIEALNMFGAFRLAAVVFTLKSKGHNIVTENIKEDDKQYARYFMVIGQ